MKLWHCKDARSFRVLWTLEELAVEGLGLDYALEMLPFPPRWRAPEFLDDNPLGTIPLLVDGATRMTESAAICQWLAVRQASAMAVAADEPDYGAWLNFLHQGEATLTFPQTLVFRYAVLEKPENRNPKVAADYLKWFLARTAMAEATLADGRDWLCAGRFTVADISVAYALLFAETLGHLDAVGPNLRAFWARCRDREGFKRAKNRQGGDGLG
ncbi:glutathione S-transferase [Polymorphobacter multimanifer]|uniref:Glutathione S-transferase n=1 Tax=Polymorphobacter multimanifer TaxID=1070431 RepID=A0A841LDU2_9SPHN|nr:glutathione S-transferase family protein [Polymorphobacter multimanifer]MBB6229193.1 glutathione S-transferase [Polymorphobacter multimanifer]GGI69692.1 glutathione S-transferase [Polymorphobacter multimanifer]